jgi:hypothetical protein
VPTSKDTLKDRLARYRQINISAIGRKSKRCARDMQRGGLMSGMSRWASIVLALVAAAMLQHLGFGSGR